MPFPRKHRLARLAAAAGAIAALAAPGTAAAADGPVCTPKVSTPVFAAFGDLRDYYLAPGGAFEDSLTWTKNSGGVAIVQGNEPFLLAGATHKTSVRMWSGGKITSPKLCVSALEPDMRFVAKHNGGGQLDVTVRVYDEDGDVASSSTGSIAPADHVTWRPSRDVHLNTARFGDSTGYIDVSFRSQGDWQGGQRLHRPVPALDAPDPIRFAAAVPITRGTAAAVVPDGFRRDPAPSSPRAPLRTRRESSPTACARRSGPARSRWLRAQSCG